MIIHSSNFLIRQIPVSKQAFSGNNDNLLSILLSCKSKFLKKHYQSCYYKMTLPQASKWKETYFETYFKVGRVLGEVWVADVCSKKIPTQLDK